MTKEKLELLIQNVLGGLDPAKVKTASDDYKYYNSLYDMDGEEFSELDIAEAVSEYPELHPQMIAIVDQIAIDIGSGKVFDLWMDTETQAGNVIALALAIHDKKYCYVYAKSLLKQDLDHEVNQNDEINELIEKWGLCKEVGLVLAARAENVGQSGSEFIEEILEEYGDEAEEVLKNAAEEFLSNEYGGSIHLAWELFRYNTEKLPLLTKTINLCDSDKLTDFWDCEMEDYWAEIEFIPEMCDLLVSYLLRSSLGAEYLESFRNVEPSLGEIMEEDANSALFLENIAKWLNSDISTAKEHRGKLLDQTDSFVKEALTDAFKAAFALEPSDAENSADKFIEIYKTGEIPTRAQIMG